MIRLHGPWHILYLRLSRTGRGILRCTGNVLPSAHVFSSSLWGAGTVIFCSAWDIAPCLSPTLQLCPSYRKSSPSEGWPDSPWPDQCHSIRIIRIAVIRFIPKLQACHHPNQGLQGMNTQAPHHHARPAGCPLHPRGQQPQGQVEKQLDPLP